MPTRVTNKAAKTSKNSSAEKMKSKEPKKAPVKTANNKVTKPVGKSKSPLPTYKEMIIEGIASLGDRNGSSRQALKKHISGKYSLGEGFENHFNLAVRRGIESGEFSQPKGPSGPLKVVKKPVHPKSETTADAKSRTTSKTIETEPPKRRRESVSKKPKEEENSKVKERRRSSASSKSAPAHKVGKKAPMQAKKTTSRPPAKSVAKPVKPAARKVAVA
ncbi:LAFA_0E18404g1_1 [Lachancea sp. 'fantastica']|nr:LAFA_0E18404g1_1 [Lachancea sp. 'fantastica']